MMMTWQLAKLCLLFTSGFSLAEGIGIKVSPKFPLAQGIKVGPLDCTAAQINCPLPSVANGFCAAGVACDNPKRCCSDAATCPDIHGYCGYPGSGSGDPHMTNIYGDKFDINYVGTHSLVRIPGYGKQAGKVLELTARVANFSHLKQISKCHPYYFNMFDLRGKMLGSAVEHLQVRRDSAGVSFDSVMVDKNQSMLKQNLSIRTTLQSSKTFGAVKVSHKTKQKRDLLVLETQSDHKVVVTIDWWNNKPGQPGLNIIVHGLSPTMETIGGLLGTDPHNNVSSDPGIKGCPKRQEADNSTRSRNLNSTKSRNHNASDVKTLVSMQGEDIYSDVGNM